MGDFIPDVDSVAEVFGGRKSHLYRPFCEEICMPHEHHHSSNTDFFLKKISVEDHDKFSSTEDWDLTAQELGITLSDILHVHDSFGSSLDLNQSNICKQEVQPLSFDTSSSEYLTKCAVMVHSELGQSHPLTIDIGEGLLSTASHAKDLFKVENSIHACSMDLPVTLKLVSSLKGSHAQQGQTLKTKMSSLKGSHAQQGQTLKTKMCVKWAPDVYDPPVTSESHTVKGSYRHRSKSKKDLHKHLHNKSKTSRSSSGDKKYAHRRSTSSLIDPRILRSKAEAMEYAIRRQESKFRGSMELPSRVHLSVAEAS